MMESAERHGELIADFERQPALLAKRQMMSLRGLAAADETGLGRHEEEMGLVPQAAFYANGK